MSHDEPAVRPREHGGHRPFGTVGLPRDRPETRGNIGPFLAPDALFPVRLEPLSSGDPLPEPGPEDVAPPGPERADVPPIDERRSTLVRLAALAGRVLHRR